MVSPLHCGRGSFSNQSLNLSLLCSKSLYGFFRGYRIEFKFLRTMIDKLSSCLIPSTLHLYLIYKSLGFPKTQFTDSLSSSSHITLQSGMSFLSLICYVLNLFYLSNASSYFTISLKPSLSNSKVLPLCLYLFS
jgi:hypothetical protein